MASYTIYHNPRCSKSRQTLALLKEHGVEPLVIEYLKSPISLQALQELKQKLGITALAMVRTKEAVFAELQLDPKAVSDNELLKAIIEQPILLERPIVTCDNKAVIGRPPENVLDLI